MLDPRTGGADPIPGAHGLIEHSGVFGGRYNHQSATDSKSNSEGFTVDIHFRKPSSYVMIMWSGVWTRLSRSSLMCGDDPGLDL